MFNWPRAAIGMTISHDMTIVNVDWRKNLIKKVKFDVTDAMIHQGELVNIDLLLKNTNTHFRGQSLALAIDDNWIEQQTFTLNHSHKKAIDYLIKQKISLGNVYDYHIHQDQCTIWQLSKIRYHSYQQLATKMSLTLRSIEPESCAKIRLFTQTLPQPYGIYYAATLYIIDHDKIVFSHHVLNDDIESAVQLFENLHQQKIHHLINPTKQDDIDPEFLTAYSTAISLRT